MDYFAWYWVALGRVCDKRGYPSRYYKVDRLWYKVVLYFCAHIDKALRKYFFYTGKQLGKGSKESGGKCDLFFGGEGGGGAGGGPTP